MGNYRQHRRTQDAFARRARPSSAPPMWTASRGRLVAAQQQHTCQNRPRARDSVQNSSPPQQRPQFAHAGSAARVAQLRAAYAPGRNVQAQTRYGSKGRKPCVRQHGPQWRSQSRRARLRRVAGQLDRRLRHRERVMQRDALIGQRPTRGQAVEHEGRTRLRRRAEEDFAEIYMQTHPMRPRIAAVAVDGRAHQCGGRSASARAHTIAFAPRECDVMLRDAMQDLQLRKREEKVNILNSFLDRHMHEGPGVPVKDKLQQAILAERWVPPSHYEAKQPYAPQTYLPPEETGLESTEGCAGKALLEKYRRSRTKTKRRPHTAPMTRRCPV